MASTVSGIKTGPRVTTGTPTSVVRAINKGYPKKDALSMGPKPRSTVKV